MLIGLCDICGRAGILHTCRMCGRRVCTHCYISTLGVCIACYKGKKLGKFIK